jgi:hypothetical protein
MVNLPCHSLKRLDLDQRGESHRIASHRILPFDNTPSSHPSTSIRCSAEIIGISRRKKQREERRRKKKETPIHRIATTHTKKKNKKKYFFE